MRRRGTTRAFWLGAALVLAAAAWADTGVLIPNGRQAPDPSILSLTEMQVDIRIDNGDARVRMRQVFANHTAGPQEGNYEFALPSGAQVSDFAVWDGTTRIPAVVLERKRADALYTALKSQSLDPGLLRQGEGSESEARRSNLFSAHIAPIAPWGTKRLELEYHQTIPVNARQSYFVLPLRPSAYGVQHVGSFVIHFELDAAAGVQDFVYPGKLLPFHLDARDAHSIRGTVEAHGIDLNEDFTATWGVAAPDDALQIITYRNPHPVEAPGIEAPPAPPAVVPGYFEALTQVPSAAPVAAVTGGRTVILLMDTSLSMQWDKLERSYAAAAKVIQSLTPRDHFNLLLFNSGVESFRPAPVAVDAPAAMAAMNWLRGRPLRGGTDLQAALTAGLKQATQPGTALVLLTDGGADRGTVQTGHLAAWYETQWKALAPSLRPTTDVFAVGDDANLPLLRLLAGHGGGALESVLSSEPVDFKLQTFLGEMGQSAVSSQALEVLPSSAIAMVYPLQDAVFPGRQVSWVGQYPAPMKSAAFRAASASSTVALPAQALEHDGLPRLWAAARVQALLDQIERNGETEAAVNEIIQLAKQYKLVTPYTSFLAAPRALLRPRVIQPGDPLLRVHTDPAIVSVIALFPFGLEQPLRYLPEGADDAAPGDTHTRVWETRFLAPPDLKDGTYTVRLILRDRAGQAYRESKTFVVDATPPTVRVQLAQTRYRAGDAVPLRVSASAWTQTITAAIDGLAPAFLRWNQAAESNTGQLMLPPWLPAGTYVIHVTAEDAAHNLGSAEAKIEVVP